MTIPAATLPSYLTVDLKSQWHIGGLLSTAFETMTLPSRLRVQDGNRASMDQLVNVLNVNGNQNIAKLRMSIDQDSVPNGSHRKSRPDVRAQSRDSRLPSQERRATGEPSLQEDQEVGTFDIDFSPAEAEEQSRGRRIAKEPHIFGQAEAYRADDQKEKEPGDNEEEAGHERARRRAAGLPIIQK